MILMHTFAPRVDTLTKSAACSTKADSLENVKDGTSPVSLSAPNRAGQLAIYLKGCRILRLALGSF